MRRSLALSVPLALLLARPSLAQHDTLRLDLAAALARAATRHPEVVQAAAQLRARQADVQASAAAFLPRLGTELGWLRSDDPVAVFGNRLRRGIFAESDFAVSALNRPAPLTAVTTALSLEQPLFQPEALLGRKAARAAARAAGYAEVRTAQAAALEVIQSYAAARLAAERLGVLTEALAVSQRTLAQVQSLRRNGTVTAVDEQLARVRVSELAAALAAAEAARLALVDQLLAALGEPPGRPVVLSDSLSIPQAVEDTLPGSRADLAALEAQVAAGDAGVARARSSWLPSAGVFGSYAWAGGTPGIANGPGHWTGGLVLRWTPFRGLADLGQLRRAEAERDAVRARLADHERRASAEARRARAERDAALTALAAAETALLGAAEAARIAGVRYSEGVGTLTDLLALRAAESSQRLARLGALYQARVAGAALAFSLGRMPE